MTHHHEDTCRNCENVDGMVSAIVSGLLDLQRQIKDALTAYKAHGTQPEASYSHRHTARNEG